VMCRETIRWRLVRGWSRVIQSEEILQTAWFKSVVS
jgi:hypothetical protein